MVASYEPADEKETVEAVAEARSKGLPMEIAGGGTKRGLGRPIQAGAALSMAKLAGITLYEPAELVISAKAGTALADVEAALDEKGQQLAFEPMDYGAIYGAPAGRPSIGSVAACNLSGPRRIYAGAARDSLIGVRVVTGKGEAMKNGGRVMKNVTGYDLVKFSAGAFGTLGILTEVTFKVLPQAETTATLVFSGLDDESARTLMSEALSSPFEITGAAHLPGLLGDEARTLLRLEGFEASITYRIGELRRELRSYGAPEVLDTEASKAEWRAIRDVKPLAERADGKALWRISTAPTRAPSLVRAIRTKTDADLFYDWGGGLIWLTVPERSDAAEPVVRAAVAEAGGHATLVRASETIRAAIDVFEPLAEPVMALTRATKSVFDPDRILNPSRMYAGV